MLFFYNYTAVMNLEMIKLRDLRRFFCSFRCHVGRLIELCNQYA